MPSFNRVMLMGNLTRDPESKTLPSGTIVSEFGLAINRHYRTQSGEEREETCFVDCAAFGRQAEVIQEYCVKGRPLFVEGRLKFDTWDDKQGGKRSKLSVIVEAFQFLGGREDGGGGVPTQRGDSRDTSRPAGRDESRPTGRDEHRPARKGRGAPNTGIGRQKKFADADIPF